MAEYIERETAENAIAAIMPTMSSPDGCGENDHLIFSAQEMCVDAMQTIHNLPAADVAPVRHGRWVKHDGYTECSACEYWYDSSENEDAGDRSNYCPNCGARMDGE